MSLAERLSGLSELLIALAASPIPTHLFQALADQAAGAVPCDYLGLCLKDADESGYLVHSLIGAETDPFPSRLFGVEEGLPGQVMQVGRVLVVEDLRTEPGTAPDLEGEWTRLGLRAALIVPVRRGRDIMGALVFAALKPIAYTPDDVQIGVLIAAGLASALESSRAYQALADERTTLAAVVGSMQDAVLMVSEEGNVLLANPAVGAMLGIEPEAITGRPLQGSLAEGTLRVLLETGGAGTTDVPLPDGRTVQASVVPVTTPYGETLGVAAILRDITLLKHLEEMENEFVNTVSHDLKNPLFVISGTAELLLRGGAGDPDHAGRCERIVKTAAYMNDLVLNLLDLGKIESGLEVPHDEIDLVPLVTDVADTIRLQADAKAIVLALELPERLVVTGLSQRLKQALLNLAGNAVKYTPDGGRVTLAVARTEAAGPGGALSAAAVVSVTDSGIGIPASAVPYVFDKFYRVKSEATLSVKGTGLGLSIARSVVESHGGRIWVESQEGRGSTFAFTLPIRSTEGAAES
jgi:PAS domain S-box-containing protein